MPSLLIREAKEEDITRLTRLHLCSSSDKEPSVVLGEEFINLFYKKCIKSSNTNILLLLDESGIVIGLSVVFYQYSNFIKEYRASAYFLFFTLIIRLFFSVDFDKLLHIFRIVNQGDATDFLKHEKVYDHHFGYMILDPQAKSNPRNIFSFIKMLHINLENLLQNSSYGAWCSARSNNTPSINMIKALKFEEVLRLNSDSGQVVYFIYKKETML